MWARIVFHLSFELEVENWQLTPRDFLHQKFPTLLVHSLKLTTFSTTKRLFVFCLTCSWCLDATQTLLRSNQPTKICYSSPSSPPSSEEKFGGSLRKHPFLLALRRW